MHDLDMATRDWLPHAMVGGIFLVLGILNLYGLRAGNKDAGAAPAAVPVGST